ncbi:hypothetical protein BCR39DRAFT_518049 [Naematelia encephala]|uniref:Uncharacterized protein n=1 Tax=Naematelia encephala TaxID=71784 RepID=A0A1Y2BHC6_9TREE|nr:hypothetical protein BCR39DRAFT_518049 [Naematelia encephala]
MGFFSRDAEDDVIVSATFPDSNPFGLVVNGEQNALSLHFNNGGTKNYTLVSAGASYHDPGNHWALIKNASTLRYGVPLVSGANFSAPFSMHSEFRPQEIGLTVWANLAETGTTDIHRVIALNQTVSIVEPQASWFDPGLLFLYLILGSALLGGAWAAYNAFFPSSGSKKGGSRSKKVKAVVPAAQDKKQYPEVKPYEEEWIPAHHLKSKASKTKKGKDGGASSAGEEVLSGGDVTSGGETSGAEGKIKRRKHKKA